MTKFHTLALAAVMGFSFLSMGLMNSMNFADASIIACNNVPETAINSSAFNSEPHRLVFSPSHYR